MADTIHLLYFGVTLLAGLCFLLIEYLEGRRAKFLAGNSIVACVSLAVSLRDVRFGADTLNYLEMFKAPDKFADFVEGGYILLLRMLGVLSDSGAFYLFVSSLAINCVVFLAFFRVNPNLAGLGFTLFCASPVFWSVNVLILRNGLAAALIMCATMSLVIAGRTAVFSLVTIAAGAIHYSTLMHGGFLFLADLSTTKRILRSGFVLAAGLAVLVYVLPLLSGFFAAWVDRFYGYQIYSAAGDFNYANSGLKIQYIIPVGVLISVLAIRGRLTVEERLISKYYAAFLVMSGIFWSNVLFRDRIYVPAQMIEPLMLAIILRRLVRHNHLYVMLGASVVVILAVVTILFWAPKNVLQIY